MPAREPHLLDVDLTTAGVPHERYAALRRTTPVPVRLRSGELNAWKRMPVRLRQRRP